MKMESQLHAPSDIPLRIFSAGTYWVGDWVGPRADLDGVEKRKICWRCWRLNPDSSVVQPIALLLHWLS
jgi:hypothetical protein